MTKKTICQECHTPNPVGSKFCSNCGARLPKSTSILCPRCHTPNPSSNFYCDKCGSRLIQDVLPPTPPATEPPAISEGDLPTSAKMFSLPSRKPGETGELDANNVPDWRKTGQIDALGESGYDKNESGRLPRLSELTPEQRGSTADLPAWLIDSDSQELLIQSPEDITTEHFLNMIRQIDDDERQKLSGLLNDPTIAGESSKLPDWLQEYVQPAEKKAPPAPPPPPSRPPSPPSPPPPAKPVLGMADEDLDWLSELGPLNTDVLAQPVDNLGARRTESSQMPDLPDWLTELGPPNTEILSRPAAQPEAPSESDLLVGPTLPDWLDELGPPNTEILAVPQADVAAKPSLAAETDVPNWLMQEPPDTDGLAQPTYAPFNAFDEAAADGLPAWLVDKTDTDSLALATPPEPPAAAARKSLTDWLTNFDAEDKADANAEDKAEEEATPLIAEEVARKSLTDWLTDFGVQAETAVPEPTARQAQDEEMPDWLIAETLAVDAPVATPEPTGEQEPTDWLIDLDEPEATEAEAEELEADEWGDWYLEEETATAVPPSSITRPDDEDILALGMTGPLPDWLDELTPVESSATPKGTIAEDVLDDLLGLMAVTPGPEAPEETTLATTPSAELDVAFTEGEEEPDWLSELAAFDPNNLVSGETAVPSPPPSPTTDDLIFAAALIDFSPDDAALAAGQIPPPVEAAHEIVLDEAGWNDAADITDILSGADEAGELPDWLDQFESSGGLPEQAPLAADQEVAISTSELPEWLTQMRPGDIGQFDSLLPSALVAEEADLYEMSDDLTGAELPEWLQDANAQSRRETVVPQSRADQLGWLTDPEVNEEEDSAELEAILADMPPALSPEEMLPKAEIPDWIQNLKPSQLTGAAIADVEARLETTGPLAGMPGVIRVEPVVAMPRGISAPVEFTITNEQRQQALLLHQLVQEAQHHVHADLPASSSRSRAGLRILVAALLLLAVGLGLLLPDMWGSQPPTSVPPMAADMNTAVQAAAGQPVLVAFDYTPAMAGELNSAAQVLLSQLQANGSPILTISQYAAGTAVAETLVTTSGTTNATSLGLLAGEAIGLRQLANCLGHTGIVCDTLQGRLLGDENQTRLQDAALIVVLTGERTNLVDWVEQVGAPTGLPLVAGVTQSLAPIATPYYASGQLTGYLAGLPATIAYQSAYNPAADLSQADAQYRAQSVVQLMAALLLLVGALVMGLTGQKPAGAKH